jgi:lantibiotic modifying enzyme
LPFRLPAKPDKVYAAVFAGMQYEHRLRNERMKKAEAIAWRICKSWLEAQITLINLEQAKLEEVFLPYLVMPSNKTLFETMEHNQFLLPNKRAA